jgi:hypothetical protein
MEIDDLKDKAKRTGQAMSIGVVNPAEAPRVAKELDVKMILPIISDAE